MRYKIKRRGPGVHQLEGVGDGPRPSIYLPKAFAVEASDLDHGLALSLEIMVAEAKFSCEAVTIARHPGAPAITKSVVDSLPLNQIIGLGVAEAALAYGSGQRRRRPQREVHGAAVRERRRRADVDLLATRLYVQHTALRLAGVKQPKSVLAVELAQRGEPLHRSYVTALIERGEQLTTKRSST